MPGEGDGSVLLIIIIQVLFVIFFFFFGASGIFEFRLKTFDSVL